MKFITTTLIFAASLTLAVSSCKKDTKEPDAEDPAPVTPTNPSGINTIADVFSANGVPAQSFTVDATVASTITANGVKIEIPANTFVTTGNATLTGIVDVQVKTILTKSDVILSGAGANAGGDQLVSSKGCVKITASQNTQQLRPRAAMPIQGMTVSVADGNTVPVQPMKKYYTAKVTAVDSTKFWALGADQSNIPTAYDAETSKYVHKAKLDSLKWLNVGFQYDSIGAPKVTVTATLNASQFTKSNTAVYLSLNGSQYLTVGAMYEVSPGVFKIKNIPAGKGATIVAVAVINGQYYSAIKPVLASPTATGIDMQAKTIDEIKTQISALP